MNTPQPPAPRLLTPVPSAHQRELERAYRKWDKHLCHYAARWVGLEHAPDVVQDAYAKYLEREAMDGAAPRPSEVRRHLFRYVHDCAIDSQRRDGAYQKALRAVSGPGAAIRRWMMTERRTEDDEIRTEVDKALFRVRASHRQVHVLNRQMELSIEETAEVLYIKDNTVRAHLVRATAALQQELTRIGFTPDGLQRRKP